MNINQLLILNPPFYYIIRFKHNVLELFLKMHIEKNGVNQRKTEENRDLKEKFIFFEK